MCWRSTARSKSSSPLLAAGFTVNFGALHYPYYQMQKCGGVNINGTYLFTVEVAKHLIESQVAGSMVMNGSMSGAVVNVPQPQAPYNAAKAARAAAGGVPRRRMGQA
ncbi:d-arabinitol [Aspergillus sp. HF37]|nr:d-arabinitol [Aspergillus sp. HF37]